MSDGESCTLLRSTQPLRAEKLLGMSEEEVVGLENAGVLASQAVLD